MLPNDFQKHVHKKMKKFGARGAYFIFLILYFLIVVYLGMNIFLEFWYMLKYSALAEAFYWRFEYPCRYAAFVTNYLFELFHLSETVRSLYFRYWWVDYIFESVLNFLQWYTLLFHTSFNMPFFIFFNILVPEAPPEVFLLSPHLMPVKILIILGYSFQQIQDTLDFLLFVSSPFAWYKTLPFKILLEIFLVSWINTIDEKVQEYIDKM